MLEPDQNLTMRADNYTLDRIQSEGERYLWILFNIVVALASLLGDSIILVVSLKYNAIHLHRVIVVLIQHLAVSDLLLAVFRVIPTIVSLFADRWILGGFLCSFLMNAQWLAYWMTGILTCCLASSKLMVVRYPLRTRFCTRRKVHLVCGVLWALTFITPPQLLLMIQGDHETMYFDYSMYICMFDYSSPYRQSALLYSAVIFAGIVQVLMYTILPLASVLLVIEARKVAMRLGEHIRWQGVLTVTVCTTLYFVSTLPAIIVSGLNAYNVVTFTVITRRAIHFFTHLNVMTNFFVYCLTVASFREFLKLRVQEVAVKIGWTAPAKPVRRISRTATRTLSTDQEMKTSVHLGTTL